MEQRNENGGMGIRAAHLSEAVHFSNHLYQEVAPTFLRIASSHDPGHILSSD